MNGKKYLLDTNAVIEILQKENHKLMDLLRDAEWIGISVISHIEFLAFQGISQEDIDLFEQFLKRITILDILNSDKRLLDQIIQIRLKYKIKLPDSIIIATANINGADLITSDKQLSSIKEINIIHF